VTADELQRAMDDAAASLDFEAAQRWRDRLAILRQTGTDPGEIEGLTRQQPGAMGLGTSQPRATPPPGWTKPRKPHPMTKGRNRRSGD
jgi:hypothetical protein